MRRHAHRPPHFTQDHLMNMPLSRRRAVARLAAAALACAAFAPPAPAQAQGALPGGWPNKPVKVIVPSGPGAQTDLFARYVTEGLAKAFGQPFVVENKPGASGNIGAMAVVKAPADGCTLLFSAASFTVVPAGLKRDQPYDILRDLAPVVQIGVGGLFLAVGGDSPIKGVKELFELARSQPGKLSYGTTGIGSTAHLIMASLLAQQGLSMTHVPYKSSADVLRDLNGGILQIGWVDTSSSLGLVKSGKVRPLALGATMRVPITPQVPTFDELGYPHRLDGWLGLFAPAGTPEPIIQALNAEVNKLLHSEEGTARLTAMNVANPPSVTPAQFAQRIRDDVQGWRKIAVDNGIHVD